MPGAFGTTVARGPLAFSITRRGGGSRRPTGGAERMPPRPARPHRPRAAAAAQHRLAGNAGARLRVEEPRVRQRVAVGVGGARGVERHRRADLRVEDEGLGPRPAVHDDARVVVRLGRRLDRPVHARGEVVLERRPPSPDRGLVGRVGLAVDADHRVARAVVARDTSRRPASRTGASRRAAGARRTARPSRRRPGSWRSRARCR